MPRGSYARASAADRARIVQCADDGDDWKQLCATLQVNPKTAYVWARQEKNGAEGVNIRVHSADKYARCKTRLSSG